MGERRDHWLPNERELVAILKAVDQGAAPNASHEIAARLGLRYDVIRNWLTGTRRIPAAALPVLCTVTENYAPLDLLEEAAGRSAGHDAHFQRSVYSVKEIQTLVKEVGEALEVIGTS